MKYKFCCNIYESGKNFTVEVFFNPFQPHNSNDVVFIAFC